MNQQNGVKAVPQLGTKDKFRQVYAELQNTQMAGRVTQAMVQQLLQNTKNLGEDMGKLFGLVNELQYKILAMQDLLKLSGADLQTASDALRLKDFNEASDKEDAKEGFTIGDVVDENSTVILTSTTNGTTDGGLFRSRIKLFESGVPELIQGLMGKAVGTKVEVKLNTVLHTVELLGIRQPKKQDEVTTIDVQATEAPAASAQAAQ